MEALPILYEDDAMVAVDKPAGLPVAAGRGADADAVVTRLQAQGVAGAVNAHRIDDAVSGVVVCAKTKPALDFLSGQFQSKTAERVLQGFLVVAAPGAEQERVTNLPVVRDAAGRLPESFSVTYGLGPDLEVPGRMHVYRKRGGRPAETHFRVVEDFGRVVWVEARPATSREMQVQAHAAAVGAPVLGDDAHGLPEVRLRLSEFKRGYKGRATERPLIERMALHQTALTLRHPETRETMMLEALLPKTFEVALRHLRKYAQREQG